MMRLSKSEPMCYVSVGFTHLLMPADKCMKLIALLQSAVECNRSYSYMDYTYTPYSEPLSVELALVKASQIRAPKAPVKPIRSGPLLLENGQ